MGAAMRHDIARRHWGGAVGGRAVGSGAGRVIGGGASSDRWIAVGGQVSGWFGCSPYSWQIPALSTYPWTSRPIPIETTYFYISVVDAFWSAQVPKFQASSSTMLIMQSEIQEPVHC